MHLETLKLFCDLADSHSFSKTAEKHLLSQSAVSQQLAQLELAYKCQLITRRKRPIELTAAGQVFYRAARDIIERHEQLKNELHSLETGVDVRINVAAIFSIGMHSLHEYIKKFMLRYPNVNVHIEYFRAERIYELVLSGEVDIGIVAIPKKDKRLDVYEFEDELLVLACSPKHPLAGEKEADIHKLQFERFIAFEKEVPTRLWIDGLLSRYNTVVRPVMEFDNIETIKRAVEINAGVSILPQATILQEVASGTLRAIPFSNERFVRPTGILVRKGRAMSQTARYLLDLLRERAE
ncbi:MAG TPA: LysR family transcriptional regulator [Sedimentisphaerales bacterium]|nr:LysR family transcriptional regulator [Sedimentisphaerales bacterium]HOV77034.1 LysR family transcriptional regulator [Sedimentisphaerales bacterium]